MSADDKDLLARQMALLRQLEGRGLARASEFFKPASGAADAPLAPTPVPARPLDGLFPEAQRLAAEGGGCCCRVSSEASPCGRRTRQGYSCPAGPYGGPPSTADLAALTGDPRWADVDPARIIYFDTETTALGLNAATYTFLIGLGWFEGDGAAARMRVDQYFMEDYADEGAIVDAADQAFAQAQALVSYNGRTFDVPLLESRWLMQRRRLRLPELHLDLLHYARRLWRLHLPDCSLGTVEHAILGVTRLSDVDGSWVPRIYFDFARGIRPERIVPVFDHHAQDIYSLGALAAAVCRAWLAPEDPRFAPAEVQWGLARLYEMRGRIDDALVRMETAVLAARDESFAFRLAMHLAKTYKRLGRLADAVAIWEARAAQATAERLDPLIELAKYAEHSLKDYALARHWVQRAMALLEGAADLAWLTATPAVDDAANGDQASAALAQALTALARRRDRIDERKARADRKQTRRPRKKRQPEPGEERPGEV